jgi:hypothetical protein
MKTLRRTDRAHPGLSVTPAGLHGGHDLPKVLLGEQSVALAIQIMRLAPDRQCRNWAEIAPTRVASGRTKVRAIAVIPLRARTTFHRTFGIDPYSLRDTAWITQASARRCCVC